MFTIIHVIWNHAKNDWRKKIIASGIIVAIIITWSNHNVFKGERAILHLSISIISSFALGVFVAFFLLAGSYLNAIFNKPPQEFNKYFVWLLCGIYALSLIPVSAMIIFITYKMIVYT